MANFLFKKSYKLSTFKNVKYDHLWGSKGVFTTIRVYGESPKYIFLKEHLLQLNKSLKKFNINFLLTEKKLLELIPSNIKIKKYNHLLRVAIKNNKISLSLRSRLKPSNIFQCKLVNYQRSNAKIKNLQYKKILSMQKNINMQIMELFLVILKGNNYYLISLVVMNQTYILAIVMNVFVEKKCALKEKK